MGERVQCELRVLFDSATNETTLSGVIEVVEAFRIGGISRCRCEEPWLSRMVNAVTIATLNQSSNVP